MTSRPTHSREAAVAFLEGHARLLERRLADVALDVTSGGTDPGAAVAAVLAYRNADGGFGHALEPDLRASTSQPIFVHFALSALRDAGATALPDAERTCDFLASTAREDGAIPYVLPDALEHARARHWNGAYALDPSLHGTAGVCAGLHALGVRHPWLEAATRFCLAEVAGEPEYTGHRLLNVLDLLAHLPDREAAEALWPRATGRLFEADYVHMDTPLTSYGLTPLHFAPTPTSRTRALFSDESVEAHLDDLAGRQQEDGGWPLTWNPPAGCAAAEWRGCWTLTALRTLRAYGRL